MTIRMRTFKQEKLWRDKAPKLMEAHGSIVHIKKLDDAAFDQELRRKLCEEADEVRTAGSREALITELADIYEVIDTLVRHHQLSQDEISELQKQKHEERGGFIQRFFVTHAEHPTGSYGEHYCLADPEKYPEILEQ